VGLCESEAIVLRTYDLAEADKIVVCLTRGAGLVRGVARGARKLRSRFGAGLEPFTLLNISYYEKEGRELVTLRHTEILRSHFRLAGYVEVITALAYMCELLMSFAPPHEPNEKLYRMVRACLNALEKKPEQVSLVLRYFEVWLLQLSGFFSFRQDCAVCHTRLAEAAKVYMDAELRPLCEPCGGGKGAVVNGSARAQLNAMQRLSPEAFVEAFQDAKPDAQREVAQMTRRLINRVLERDVREAAI
jgi:DNA repair protein RecO